MSFWNSWNPSGRRNVARPGAFEAELARQDFATNSYFMNLARNQMNPGTGNGGYGVGRSPDDLFQKARTGLANSQAAGAQAEADRLGLLQNMYTKDPDGFMKFMRGETTQMPSWGMSQPRSAAGINFIQFPGGPPKPPEPERTAPENWSEFKYFSGGGAF